MSRRVRKRTFGHVRPLKIQIRLGICAVWSESSLGSFWIAKDAMFPPADNKDADQTADELTDLCLRWMHKSEGMFSHVVAQIYSFIVINMII